MKMKIILLFLSYTVVNTIPIKVTNDSETNFTERNKENGNEIDNELDSADKNIMEKHTDEKSRAGIIDNLNPFNKSPGEPPQTKENNGNTQNTNNNNPLQAVQNLFSNVPQFLNGSNPFEQLFSSQPGGNFLDNIKVFLVGTQGIVMPASSIFGGFQNLMQTFGNMGNSIQLPSLPLN